MSLKFHRIEVGWLTVTRVDAVMLPGASVSTNQAGNVQQPVACHGNHDLMLALTKVMHKLAEHIRFSIKFASSGKAIVVWWHGVLTTD